MLTDSTKDVMYGVQRKNPLPGFEPRIQRRPTRHKSVFFNVISMAGRVGRESGSFPLVRCSKPALSSHQPSNFGGGFNYIPKENDMINPSINPVKDAIFDLEIIEYDLKRAVQLLVNISCEERELPDEIHYLIDRVHDHTEEVSTIYNRLINGMEGVNV